MTTQRVRRIGLHVAVALVLVATSTAAVKASTQQVSLEQIGSIPVPGVHRVLDPTSLVRARNGYAYISTGRIFMIFDVADPTAPRRLGSYEFPEEIWGFRLAGSRAYVGANFFGLGILDISDPAAPKLVSSHDTLGQAKIGAVFETKIVIIDHMEGLVMLDASNEAEPTVVGSFFLDGYARDVVTLGKLAYAVDSPTGLYLFDLSEPGPPNPVSVLHAPSAPHSIEVSSASGNEGPTLVCGAGGGNLQVYDVSNPMAPVKTATFETPGRAERVALEGTLAYVADGRAGVHIVDLSTPSEPRSVGSYETAGPARDVGVSGSHVFVVVGNGKDAEVLILKRS